MAGNLDRLDSHILNAGCLVCGLVMETMVVVLPGLLDAQT